MAATHIARDDPYEFALISRAQLSEPLAFDDLYRTMCPSIDPGREVWRTLTAADKHVFRSRYEAR